MLLGMRPQDPRYSELPNPASAKEADGALGCVIMVSPVIDPLGRYRYAKGLRDDCTPPAGVAERVVSVHELYWEAEEAVAEAAPARMLARSERTSLPPTLCLARSYEEAHPRPDFDEFIQQYQKAGGQLDVTIFEGEGERILQGVPTPVAKQALEEMTSFIYRLLGQTEGPGRKTRALAARRERCP